MIVVVLAAGGCAEQDILRTCMRRQGFELAPVHQRYAY